MALNFGSIFKKIQEGTGDIISGRAFNNVTGIQAPSQQQQQQNRINFGNALQQANPTNITKPTLGVTLGDIGRQTPSAFMQTGQGVAQGAVNTAKGFIQNPINLANQISYAAIQHDMGGKLDRGEISYNTYNQIVSDAARKAGLSTGDSAGTTLRKVGGATFGTATDVLGAGALPGAEGANALVKGIQGATLGAGSGLATAAQQNKVTARDYATNAAGGALLGAAPSALGAAGHVIAGRAFGKQLPARAIANDISPSDLKGAALQSHLGKVDLKTQQAADLAASQARALDPNVQLKVKHFQDPGLQVKHFQDVPQEPLKINRFDSGIDPKTGMGKVSFKGTSIGNDYNGKLPLRGTPDPNAPTVGEVMGVGGPKSNKELGLGVVKEGDHTQAILNASTIKENVVSKGNTALKAIQGLSDKDHALMDSLRTTSPQKLAKQAENPKAFLAAAEKVKAYNDYTHSTGTGLGQQIPYREKYGAPLQFDLSTPEAQAANEAFKAKLATTPGYSKDRTLADYNAGAEFGLQRANKNFAGDLSSDVQRRANDLQSLTLHKGLNEAYPNQVKVGEIGAAPGGTYKQLQIAGGSKLSLPAEVADQINKRAQPVKSNVALRAYDTANAGLKQAKLGGGLFHGVTTAGTVGGQQVASGNIVRHPIQNLKLIAGTLSNRAHEANLAGFEQRGTLENARLSGVTLGREQILADTSLKKFEGAPVIKQLHEAVFGRQIPEAKLTIFEQQTKGLDPSVPEDLAKMRQVASAVNNLGGINRAVEGLTPRTAKQLSRGLLATDFTEGKFRTITDAISKGGPQGKIARQMVVGKTLVFALPGLTALTAAGKIDWNNPDDVAKNIADQVLDPSIPTPFKGKTGIGKVAKTPETFISELGRIVKPMFDGSSDPLAGAKHYAGARLAALPSAVEGLATNQDYAGNPIVAQKPDGSIDVGKSASNLGTANLPIPISQALQVGQGKQTAAQALVNTAGFRVVADQKDPQMQAFALENKLVNGLSAEDKAKWDSVYGKKTDQYGNPITVTPALDSQDKAYTLLTNPQLIDAGRQVNDFKKSQGLPSDPFFELDPKQAQVVLNLAVDKFRNPAERTLLKNQNNSWLTPYYAARNQYFDSLNLPPSTKTAELPQPVAPSSMNEYSNISDATAKRSYLANHPELSDYFTQQDNYIRKGRELQGLPQFDRYPTASPAVQKLMDQYSALPKGEGPNGKSPTRSAWIKSHPSEWAKLSDQFSKQSLYNLQQDMQQSAYEGVDPTEKGIKAIASLGNSLNQRNYSSGSGRVTFKNLEKYGSTLRQGAKFNAPKISVAKSAPKGSSKGRVASTNKPKVSIKKSLV